MKPGNKNVLKTDCMKDSNLSERLSKGEKKKVVKLLKVMW